MRKLMIKYLAMNYDYKVFGRVTRSLRAVSVEIVLFCIAGLYNVLTPGFDWLQAASFIPFLAVFFIWQLYFKENKIGFEEMDWEQQYQYLQRKDKLSKWDKVQFENLENRFNATYNDGGQKFINSHRFFFSFFIIAISFFIYKFFGFYEAGFGALRFF